MIIYFNKHIYELELSDGEMGVVSYSERKSEKEREIDLWFLRESNFAWCVKLINDKDTLFIIIIIIIFCLQLLLYIVKNHFYHSNIVYNKQCFHCVSTIINHRFQSA